MLPRSVFWEHVIGDPLVRPNPTRPWVPSFGGTRRELQLLSCPFKASPPLRGAGLVAWRGKISHRLMPADRTFSGSRELQATSSGCIMVQPSPRSSTGAPRGKGTGQRDWSTSDFSRTYGGKRLNPEALLSLLTLLFLLLSLSLLLLLKAPGRSAAVAYT